MTEIPKPPPRKAPSAVPIPGMRVRFSLRTLLIGITLFAFWCALVSLLPHALTELVVGAIWIAATGWLVTGVIFASGDQRAFCIGAAVVLTSMWTGVGGRFMGGFHSLTSLGLFSALLSNIYQEWIDLLILGAAAVANGWFCIWARRYFQRDSLD